jgi:hypothetical protein
MATTRANTPKRNPWPWIIGGVVGAVVGPFVISRALTVFSSSTVLDSLLEIVVVLVVLAAWVLVFQRSKAAAFGALIGAALSSAVLFALAFLFFDGLGRGSDYTNLSPAKLSASIGIQIPASATNVYANQVSWQDSIVHARFELKRDELEGFLRANHLNLEPKGTFTFQNSSLDRAWWKPEDGVRVGVYRLEIDPKKPDQEKLSKTGYSISLQVNEAEAGRVFVYVQAFNT